MPSNKEFIERLLKYKNVLVNLKKLGIVKVFSDNIGDATGLSCKATNVVVIISTNSSMTLT